MSPELHQRVRKLFDDALQRPESERLAFVKAACSDDDEAFQTVVRLLDAYKPAQSFLEERPRGIERIGRYMITGELGRGAMGVVYDAVDPVIGRNVAVKVIHVEALADEGKAQFLRERLFREARSAGQLFHQGIVTVLDVGQEGELAFIAMERVDGFSLQRTLASGQKLEQARILDVLRQTAAALDFAHRNGVVHCDVKPANIILDRSGVVKLTDFGIAKIASTQYHTRTGLLMGTPSYMSPEQIEAHPVDGRSDQFSLAVVAFELLGAALPFRAESLAGLAHAIVYVTTPSVRAANPQLPEGVDGVLDRGLAKSAGDRFPSCAEFVRELETSLNRASGPTPILRPVSIPVAALVSAPTGTPRAKTWGLAAAGVVGLALAAAGVYRATSHPAPAGPSASPVSSTPVQPPPVAAPVVARFIADPPSIKAGASATLRWEVSGAGNVVIDPDVGILGASETSKRVKPRATTVYTLTATGPGGQMATEQVSVTVADGPSASKLYEEATQKRNAARNRKADERDAILEFKQAANQGDTLAMMDLADMYWYGYRDRDGGEPVRDYAAGIVWETKAADRGNTQAMLNLGGMNVLGPKNLPPNYVDALNWFGMAEDKGNADTKAAAEYDLGGLYEKGYGVTRNLETAKDYYEKAVKLGNLEARIAVDRLKKSHPELFPK